MRQVLRSIRRHDPELAEHIRETVLTPANRMQYDNWLEKGFPPTAFSLKQLLRAIFASAPLSRVMMRHNRALLRVYQQHGELKDNLAHRHVLPMRRIQYTAQEKAGLRRPGGLRPGPVAAGDRGERSAGAGLHRLLPELPAPALRIEPLGHRRDPAPAARAGRRDPGIPGERWIARGPGDRGGVRGRAGLRAGRLGRRDHRSAAQESQRGRPALGAGAPGRDAREQPVRRGARLVEDAGPARLRAAAQGPGPARPHPPDGDLQPVLGHRGGHRPALQAGEPEAS